MDSRDKIVCIHMELTEGEFIDIIQKKGLKTIEEVMEETDAGSVCGTCIPKIKALLWDLQNKEQK